jgi:hypothetical protein
VKKFALNVACDILVLVMLALWVVLPPHDWHSDALAIVAALATVRTLGHEVGWWRK